jgi:hypothetical protein
MTLGSVSACVGGWFSGHEHRASHRQPVPAEGRRGTGEGGACQAEQVDGVHRREQPRVLLQLPPQHRAVRVRGPPEQPEPEPELAAAAAAAGGTLTPHPPPPPRQSQLHPALQGLASGGGAAKPSKFSELRDLPMDDGDDDELEGGGGESLLLLFRVC